MGGCQKLWSLCGYPKYIRCRTIIRTQKRTLVLTTTHMNLEKEVVVWLYSSNSVVCLSGPGYEVNIHYLEPPQTRNTKPPTLKPSTLNPKP